MGYARGLSTPEDDFDRDAAQMSEARVINVSPFTARFEIATVPGSKPRRYKLEPGDSIHLQYGYTQEFQGAGRQPVRATIESLTEREAFPGGPTLPMVCHVDKQAQVARSWAEALARANTPPKPVKVMLPTANGGEPVEMIVQPAPPAFRAPIEDDEDQDGGPLDEPPPDHNEPDPVELPEAPKAKKGRS